MRRHYILLLIIVFLNACAFSISSTPMSKINMPSDIPSPIELENKITKLYESETNHDWRIWYSLTSSVFKKDYSIEEFGREHWVANPKEEYIIVSWGIKNITSRTRQTIGCILIIHGAGRGVAIQRINVLLIS